MKITSSAVAGRIDNAAKPCALCVFGLVRAEAGSVLVQGGGSLYATSADASSSGTISAIGARIYLTNEPVGTHYQDMPPIVTGQAVADPFQSGSAPVPPPTTQTPTTCTNETLNPGIYASMAVTGDCDLADGVFQFNGDVNVAGFLRATNATLNLQSGASFTLQSGQVDISGPAPGNHFVIYADNGSVTVQSGQFAVTGDVYVPRGELRLEAGSVDVTGSTAVGSVDATAGDISVSSAGTAAPQRGRPDVALVR